MRQEQRKNISYGVGDIAASLSYTAINTFFLFFLVDVVGLSPLAAGLVVIIGRVIDAISDPLMGWWLDRRQQHLHWMLWGSIPFGLSFVLMWSLELFPLPSPMLILVAALTFSVHTLAFTFVQVPYTALTPRLARDYHSRTQLTAYRVAFGTFASLLGAALPPLLAAWLGGWYGMAWVLAIIMVCAYALCIVGVRPHLKKDGFTARNVAHNPSPSNIVRQALQEWFATSQSRGFPRLLLIFTTITLGLAIVTSMMPFFLRSLLLEPWQETLLLGLLFIIGIVSLPLWTGLSERRGKAPALIRALVLLSLTLPCLVITVPHTGLSLPLVLCVVVAGMPVGALLLFPWSMLPDVLEVNEKDTGQRPEGTLYALFTFFQKIANALAIGLNALILKLVRYDETLSIQNTLTTNGIHWAIGGIAGMFFMVACLALWKYPINAQSHQNIRRELS